MKTKLSVAAALAALIVVSSINWAGAAELVVNGGFEIPAPGHPDFPAGWTASIPSLHRYDSSSGGGWGIVPSEGSYFLGGSSWPDATNLSQNLVTTPAGAYNLSFAFNPAGKTDGDLKVYWGGSIVDDIVLHGNLGWSVYNYVGLTASSDNTTLLFSGFNQSGGIVGLDSVSVQASVTTPLPAALPLFATGLGVLGLLGWRRRKQAA